MHQYKTSVYWIHLDSHTDFMTDGYIGVSINPEHRFWQHNNDAKQNKHCNSILSEQLKTSVVTHTILYVGDTQSAYEYETYLRPTRNIGWNIAAGGIKPPSNKGKIRSEEHSRNISVAKTGKSRPPVTDETRKKISEKMRGRTISEDARQLIKTARANQVFSDADRAKMSASHIGQMPSNCVSVQTPKGVYSSYKKAGIAYGVTGTTIKKWILSKKNGFTVIEDIAS